jgi:hypothetical protein
MLRLTTYVTAGPGITSRIAAPVTNNINEEWLISILVEALSQISCSRNRHRNSCRLRQRTHRMAWSKPRCSTHSPR